MNKDETIDELMEAIADDFTFDELLDVSYMRQELNKLLRIKDHEFRPLLFGAIQLKTLRHRRQPRWSIH